MAAPTQKVLKHQLRLVAKWQAEEIAKEEAERDQERKNLFTV